MQKCKYSDFSISIPTENVRKPEVVLRFRGVIEMEYLPEMG